MQSQQGPEDRLRNPGHGNVEERSGESRHSVSGDQKVGVDNTLGKGKKSL